jgi:TB2/DP1, HVA22 family
MAYILGHSFLSYSFRAHLLECSKMVLILINYYIENFHKDIGRQIVTCLITVLLNKFHHLLPCDRFPLWHIIKLLFCCWLVLPVFNGAAYIYESHVRRYVKIGGYVNSNYSERQRTAMQMMSLDARKAVERYIETHGPDAFDRVIQAVTTTKNLFYLCIFALHYSMITVFNRNNYKYVVI